MASRKGRRREEEEEEEEEEGEGEEQKRYGFLGFCMESCIFWISRLFGMDY